MANFRDQFREVLEHWRRWHLPALVLGGAIAASLAVILPPLFGPWLTHWWAYRRHFARMEIDAAFDPGQCSAPGRPILIQVKNASTKTVVELSFYVNASRRGEARDVSNGGEWNGNGILSGGTLKICTPAVLIGEAAGEDPRNFVWQARLSWVRFSD